MKNIFKIRKTSFNRRLAEMGVIKGTIFRIVKRLFGMVQIRLKDSDLVIREETFDEIDYK